ncbi:MAG: helix-turn-helix transcriptional regulator [Deferribacterales bacterium]|nr:helix-turn-helix transcriptional regulator [Deferribacterales bacterium]
MLGKRLRKFIRNLKVKQVELAEHLGISPSRLSNYLSDKREPDFVMLIEMVKYLGTDLNTLAGVEFTGIPECKRAKGAVATVREELDVYKTSDSSDTVQVVLQPINAKKCGINVNYVPVNNSLLTDVDEPEKNVSVFHINSSVSYSITGENDYVICAKCFATDLSSGDTVFENGRMPKFFKYYEGDENAMLVNVDNDKEHVFVPNQEILDNYYKVLWMVKKF